VLKTQALKPALVAGLLIAFAGALALTGVPAGGSASGKLLVALAAVLLGTQLCLVRVLAGRAGALPTIAWQHLGCAAICASVAVAFPGTATGAVPSVAAFVAALGYEVVVVHAGCAVAQALLLARHGAAEVGAFSLARPVVGLGLAWAIAGESPAAGSLLGAALVAVGLLVIYRGPFVAAALISALRARFGLTARGAVVTSQPA
jgi:drug/metabolite transporter (DMT)-like permease